MSSVYTINTESRWFPIVVLIISTLIAIFCGFNVYYYNQIRITDNCPCSGVTQEQATVMFWINLIIVIVSIILLLWSIWRIIFSEKYRATLQSKVADVLEAPTGIINKKTPILVTTSTPMTPTTPSVIPAAPSVIHSTPVAPKYIITPPAATSRFPCPPCPPTPTIVAVTPTPRVLSSSDSIAKVPAVVVPPTVVVPPMAAGPSIASPSVAGPSVAGPSVSGPSVSAPRVFGGSSYVAPPAYMSPATGSSNDVASSSTSQLTSQNLSKLPSDISSDISSNIGEIGSLNLSVPGSSPSPISSSLRTGTGRAKFNIRSGNPGVSGVEGVHM